ncbi:MAG: MerR family DNA-binding transcriptional regulator [Planctomycetota bacterium]
MPKASPKSVRLNDYLTVNLAAELLGLSASTHRNWDGVGELRAIRHPVNGYRRYRQFEF